MTVLRRADIVATAPVRVEDLIETVEAYDSLLEELVEFNARVPGRRPLADLLVRHGGHSYDRMCRACGQDHRLEDL